MDPSLIKIVQSLEQEAESRIQEAVARSIEEKASMTKNTDAQIRELEIQTQSEVERIRKEAHEALQRELDDLKKKFEADLEQTIQRAATKLPDSIHLILERMKGG